MHGNVTVHSGYLNRVLDRALKAQAGVAVLHSHPGSGWQGMSDLDHNTERKRDRPVRPRDSTASVGDDNGLRRLLERAVLAGIWARRPARSLHGRAARRSPIHERRFPTGRLPSLCPPTKLGADVGLLGSEAQARLARTHLRCGSGKCRLHRAGVSSALLKSRH